MEPLTIATPSGLADVVAYTLGYEPSNTLVVVFLDALRISGMLSLQIPDHDDTDRDDAHGEVLAEVARGALATGDKMPGAALVLAFTDHYATGSCLGYAAADTLRTNGRDVDEVMIVSNGQVHTTAGTSRREVLDPDAADVLAAAYGTPLACRADAIEDYRPADVGPRTDVEQSAAWEVWAALLDVTGPDVTHGPSLACAGVLLADITARDRFVGYLLHRTNLGMTPPPLPHGEREWLTSGAALRTVIGRLRAVCRATPAPQAANILAVTALVEGFSGNGARARIAADLAEQHQPGHTFAHLILTALGLGANIRALYQD